MLETKTKPKIIRPSNIFTHKTKKVIAPKKRNLKPKPRRNPSRPWTKIIDKVSTSWTQPQKKRNYFRFNVTQYNRLFKYKWFENKSTRLDNESVLNRRWCSISSALRTTEDDKTGMRIMKYRIYPNKDLQKFLNKAFGTQRFIRNQAISYTERYTRKAWRYKKDNSINLHKDLNIPNDVELTKDKEGNVFLLPLETNLCRMFTNSKSQLVKDNEWLLKYNSDFRNAVIRNLLTDYKSCFARHKKDHKRFKMHYSSKKQEKTEGSSFSIRSRDWKTGGWWRRFTSDILCRNKRSGHQLPEEIEAAVRFKSCPDGSYYICIPTALPKPKRSKSNLFVIDPGYRTCFTGINFRDNVLEEIGNGMSYQISRMIHNMNKLKSRATKKVGGRGQFESPHRKRYHLKRAIARASKKISNRIDDLHKSSAKYMCENFSTIVIPKLDFHNLKGISRRQKSMAARVSHCRFVDCLINKSKQYKNCHIIVTKEEYTSKTCSRCGIIHWDLGSSKVFDCPNCSIKIGRDENAAYNILMKTIHTKCGKSFCSLLEDRSVGACALPNF